MPKLYLLHPDGTYSDAANYRLPPEEREDGTWVTGVPGDLAPYQPLSLNQQLENAFLQILPTHFGQPYLSDATIALIMQAKVAVIDANKIDPTGALTQAIIRGIPLPAEMETARQQLLELLPE